MLLLSEHLIKLIQSPESATWAANSNARLVPDLVRVAGVQVEKKEGLLTLFISLRYGSTFLTNTATTDKIAFLLASVKTFESYQLKGRFLTHQPCTSDEVAYQKRYVDGFTDAVEKQGASPKEKFFDSFFQQPSVAVRMQVEEVYEQTPKQGTGTKVSVV